MLTYIYKVTTLYKQLTVINGDGRYAMVIFDWYGLSKPNSGVNVETFIALSKEQLDEVNQVVKDRGMGNI